MATKKLPSSKGFFNKEMLAILNSGETKKKSATKKTATKKKSK